MEGPDNLQKALAWNEYLSDNAECISLSKSSTGVKIRLDGSSERHSVTTADEIKNRIAACREAYENVGIIGNIIDLMVDFALEDFTIVHPSKPVQNFYINWATSVGLYQLSEQILKGIFRDSNVPILKMRGELPPEDISRLRKAVAKKGVLTTDESGRGVIPIAYHMLDVLRLEKQGSDFVGAPEYYYQMPTEDMIVIQNPTTPKQKKLVKDLEANLGIKFNTLKETGRLWIPAERLTLLYYKKDAYKTWANPMLWRVMDDVKFKKLLRDMDVSVAESVCNTLTFIKIGNSKEGLFPSPAKYAKLASLLKVPTRSKLLLWDDLIDIKAEYPPVDKILGKEKYEQVDNDIRSGCGIPEVLINGGGGNFAQSFLSVKTLLERLDTGRGTVLHFINNQLLDVSKAMGFRRPAWVKMRHMNLSNEEIEKRLLLELVDRNMVSYRTIVERFGENFDIEVERMKQEDVERKNLSKDTPFVMLKTGKFGPQHTDGPITLVDILTRPEVVAPEPGKKIGNPAGQEDQGEKGGRPSGTKRKQTLKRKTKPKGSDIISSSVEAITIDPDVFMDASHKIDKIVQMLEDGYINEKHEPCPDDIFDVILDATVRAMILFPDKEPKINEIIEALVGGAELATAPAKLEKCVDEVKKKKVEKFEKNKGRKPDKQEMKDIISSAWAICQAALK